MFDIQSLFEEWEGVLGPQDEDESLFYEVQLRDEEVQLVGPSPGQVLTYSLDEFENQLEASRWVRANNDWEREVYVTPDGERPY